MTATVTPGRPATDRLLVALVYLAGLLAGALTGGGVLSLVEAASPPFPALMALRLLEGASHLAIVVAAPPVMAAAASDAARPSVMGLWATFMGVGFAAMGLVAGPVLAAGGTAALFALHGLAMLALAALLWRRLPHVALAGRGAPGGLLAAHRAVYTAPRRAAPALGFVWYTLMYVSLLTFLPPRLGPAAAVALPLASLVGTLAGGTLAGRIPPRTVLLSGFAGTAVLLPACWLLPPAAGLATAAAGFAVMGLVPAATFASVPVLNPAPQDQARASGAIAQMGNVGSTLGTPLFALALAGGDPGGLNALIVALCACGMAAVLLGHRAIARAAAPRPGCPA